MSTKNILFALLAIMLTSCGMSASAQEATSVSTQSTYSNVDTEASYPVVSIPPPIGDEVPYGYHAEKVPGSVEIEDLTAGLQVCVHLPTASTQQWSAEIIESKSGGLTIREQFPDHVETHHFPYYGYGLTADPNGIWSNVWMTKGAC